MAGIDNLDDLERIRILEFSQMEKRQRLGSLTCWLHEGTFVLESIQHYESHDDARHLKSVHHDVHQKLSDVANAQAQPFHVQKQSLVFKT